METHMFDAFVMILFWSPVTLWLCDLVLGALKSPSSPDTTSLGDQVLQ